MQQLTSALASLLLIAMLVAVFIGARRRAAVARSARTRLLMSGVASVALGLVAIVWLPRLLPETPGSPGTLVGVALLWIMGSLLVGFGIPVLLGAWLVRRDNGG